MKIEPIQKMHRILLRWRHSNNITISIHEIYAKCLLWCLLPVLCSDEIDEICFWWRPVKDQLKIQIFPYVLYIDADVIWHINYHNSCWLFMEIHYACQMFFQRWSFQYVIFNLTSTSTNVHVSACIVSSKLPVAVPFVCNIYLTPN